MATYTTEMVFFILPLLATHYVGKRHAPEIARQLTDCNPQTPQDSLLSSRFENRRARIQKLSAQRLVVSSVPKRTH